MIRFIAQSNPGWCVIELQKLNISNAPLLEYFYQGVKKYQLYFDYENVRLQRAKFADPENYTYHKRNEPRSSLCLLKPKSQGTFSRGEEETFGAGGPEGLISFATADATTACTCG